MRDPDEAIDRVMQGLREAKTPEGMEQRIAAAMRERTVEARVTGVRPWMWSFGAMSVAAVALAVVWMHRAPQQQTNHAVATPTIESAAVTSKKDAADVLSHETLVRPLAGPKVRHPEKPSIASASDEDAVAMSEMNAPSTLAPPVPLTDQERLLLRVIHKGDPVELAMMGPVKRAAWDAKEKAEYESFFKEPPVVHDERGNE